jgi:hypothetical protein
MNKLSPLLSAVLARGTQALHGTSLHIGLSKNAVGLLRTWNWPRRRSELLIERTLDASSQQAIANGLRAALVDANCSRMTATVVLADDLTRLFMVTPPNNAERLRDCHAAAAMRFQSLYGEPPHDWKIDADWDARHPFLACAVSRSLLAALQQMSADSRLTLIGIVPQFIAAWNRWQRRKADGAWYGTMHGDTVTLGVIAAHRLTDIRRMTVPADAHHDEGWLSDQVTREALRLALPLPSRIHLAGSAPDRWFADSARTPVCARLEANLDVLAFAGESAGVALACTGVRR